MREIKFRAWHKKWNKWIHDELDIFINPEGEVIERYDYSYETAMRDISNSVDIVFYTGLKDKNGKEIYEGDILSKTIVGVRAIWQVFMSENGIWSITNNDGSVSYLYEINRQYEIVGNIYETPTEVTP